ncbi:MAG: integrase [Salinisphaeraceae bacterium]|nr:integrase [Salinisphaeraceae bacterium]
MATIRKTSSGTWQAQVRRHGWPQQTRTFRIKRDAQDWAASVEDEMRRGQFVRRGPAESLSVGAALDRYLKEVVPTKKATTQVGNRHQAATLKKFFAAYSLAAVSPELVAQFRDKRREQDGLAPNTVRVELALLSHLFETAIREWRVGLVANPVRTIRWPSPAAGRDRRLSREEEARLLEACDAHSNPMLGWMVRLALATGMRAGEIQRLHRQDVDLAKRVVTLRDTKNRETRAVPLVPEAVSVLAQALKHPIRPIDTDLVFFGEPGRNGRRSGFEYKPVWRRIKLRIGLGDLRFHDLRHEAVSRFVEMGLGDQEVASISGHRSMQMLKRYTHLRAQDLVARLDSISGNGRER